MCAETPQFWKSMTSVILDETDIMWDLERDLAVAATVPSIHYLASNLSFGLCKSLIDRRLTAVAGRSAVAAARAVAVEDGPGLTAAATVFTSTGRTPERENKQLLRITPP